MSNIERQKTKPGYLAHEKHGYCTDNNFIERGLRKSLRQAQDEKSSTSSEFFIVEPTGWLVYI